MLGEFDISYSYDLKILLQKGLETLIQQNVHAANILNQTKTLPMPKPLTCWQLVNRIRKHLGASHPINPLVLSYLEKWGWIKQQKPFQYTLCPGIAPTQSDVYTLARDLDRIGSSPIAVDERKQGVLRRSTTQTSTHN
jgi:hypothetical protein